MGTVAVILIVAAIAYIIVSPLYDSRKMKRQLRERIIGSWGKEPSARCRPEELESIAGYFHNHSAKSRSTFTIDDITWHDLEMDDVFIRLNNTMSTPGEETLYRLLREPSFDVGDLIARRELIEFFRTSPSERIKIQMVLARLGKRRQINATDCLFQPIPPEPWKSRIYALLSAMALVSPLFLFLNSGLGVLLIVFSFMTNMIVYYTRQSEIAAALVAMVEIVRLVQCARKIICAGPAGLGELKSRLESKYQKIRKIEKRGYYLFLTRTGTLADMLGEYIKIILLKELIDYEYLRTEIFEQRDVLIDIYDTVGLIDSLIAVASFRESVPFYCEPNLDKIAFDSPKRLEFERSYHPLIKSPVGNSLVIDRPVLVTGSNASGKSTFLKTVAINAIFAQSIYTCLAKKYSSSLFAVFSSMALRDSMRDGESYFIAEIKSIKRMLDHLNDAVPCLCLIDEVLRGTNTVERIAASAQVLHHLSGQNCICLAATHDIELTFILEGRYRNVHFQEAIVGDEVIFDYQLRDDRSTSRNAIKLLSLMGYGMDIVAEAEKRAGNFASRGHWMGT